MPKVDVEHHHGDVVLETNLHALRLVLSFLWKPEYPHLKLNIFDTLEISHSGVCSWLFTSSDGLVKSKSKSKWNADNIFERCNSSAVDPSVPQCLGSFTEDGKRWSPLTKADVERIVKGNIPSQLILFGHLSQYINMPPTLIEQSYDAARGKLQPKFSTSILCDPTNLKSPDSRRLENIVPTKRITCLNKVTVELCKKFILELIRQIESRQKSKIQTCRIVVVLENENRHYFDVVKPEKNVWLHHVREMTYVLTYSATDPQLPSVNRVASERKTSVSSTISIGPRSTKCAGDFCTCDEQEESRNMRTFGEGASSVLGEVLEAKRRHRKLSQEEMSRSQDAIQRSRQQSIDSNEAAEGDEAADENLDELEDQFNEDQTCTLAVKAAVTIPYKSIALARQDMQDLLTQQQQDSSSGTSKKQSGRNGVSPTTHEIDVAKNWPELLVHWWNRVGKNIIIRKGHLEVPQSSGTTISAALLAARSALAGGGSEAGSDEVLNMGDVTSSPRTVLSKTSAKTNSTAKLLPRLSSGESEGEEVGSEGVPYDLVENSFSGKIRKSTGQISRFYAEAKVCHKCYNVYCDLDLRRKQAHQLQLREQQEKEQLSQKQSNYDKEIEKKIFDQRKQISRLSSKNSVKKTSQRLEPLPSDSQIYDPDDTLSDTMLRSMSQDQARRDRNDQSTTRAKRKAKKQQVPSATVLPPMPWQLQQEDLIEKYDQLGSAFVRNIGQKPAEHIAALKKYQLPSLSEAPSARLDDESVQDEWKMLTGQYRREPVEQRVTLAKLHEQDKKAKLQGKETAQFDPQRLLHPYQRDLDDLKRQMDPTGEFNRTNKPLEHQPMVKILLQQKPKVATGMHSSRKPSGDALANTAVSEMTKKFPLLATLNQPSLISQVSSHAVDRNESIAFEPSQELSKPKVSANSASPLKKGQSISTEAIQRVGQTLLSPLMKQQSAFNYTESDSLLSSLREQASSTKRSTGLAERKGRIEEEGEDQDDENEEDGDEGIGWSPFVIPK